MKIIKIDNLKDYQKYLLCLLLFFHEFCKKNNIDYSLIDGTLLGAVRERKMIEWDDDVDVCLTRKNLEKLKKAFESYNGRYRLNCLPNQRFSRKGKKDFLFIHHQLIDTKCSTQRYNIDIFTVDYLGDDLRLANKAIKKSRLFWKLSSIGPTFHLPSLKHSNSFGKNLLNLTIIIFFPLAFCIHFILNRLIIRRYIIFEKKCLSFGEESKYFTIEPFLGRFGISDDNIVGDGYSQVELNGNAFMAFAKYELYLKKTYGNYMVPPPVKERAPEHSLIEKKPIFIEDDLQLKNYLSRIK